MHHSKHDMRRRPVCEAGLISNLIMYFYTNFFSAVLGRNMQDSFWELFYRSRGTSPPTLRQAKACMNTLCVRMPSKDAASILFHAQTLYDDDAWSAHARAVFDVGALSERLSDAAALSPDARACVWANRDEELRRASTEHAMAVRTDLQQRSAACRYMTDARTAYEQRVWEHGDDTLVLSRVQSAVLACSCAHEVTPCDWHTLQLEGAPPFLRMALVYKVISLVREHGRACVPPQVYGHAIDVAARDAITWHAARDGGVVRRPFLKFLTIPRWCMGIAARWRARWRRRAAPRVFTFSTSPA